MTLGTGFVCPSVHGAERVLVQYGLGLLVGTTCRLWQGHWRGIGQRARFNSNKLSDLRDLGRFRRRFFDEFGTPQRRTLVASATDKSPVVRVGWVYSRGGQTPRAWLGVLALFLGDRGFRWLFSVLRIRFPSSLAGMLFLFLLLLLTENRAWPTGLPPSPNQVAAASVEPERPSIADNIVLLVSPGLGLVTRWLAIFFVPNLIMLPHADAPHGSALLRLVLALCVGLIFSLVSSLIFVSILAWVSDQRRGATKNRRPTHDQPLVEKVQDGNTRPERSSKLSRPESPGLRTGNPASSGPRFALIGLWGLVWIVSAVCWITGAGASADFRALALWLHQLSSTVVGFSLGQRLPSRFQKVLHPLVSCVVFTYFSLWMLACGTGSAWSELLLLYMRRPGKKWPPAVTGNLSAIARSTVFALGGPGNLLLSFLGPAVLSFAFQMYQRRTIIRANGIQVIGGCLMAAFFGMLGSAALARLFCLPASLRLVFAPRSITAPLAIGIADILETDATLTATVVVITGLLGANFGRLCLDILRPVLPSASSPVARGLAMGASAHGLGTAAISEEPDAFPFSAIAMALVGTLSALMVTLPPFRALLSMVAGTTLGR